MPHLTAQQLRSLEKRLQQREKELRVETRRQSDQRAEASSDMIEIVGDDADKSAANLIVHVDNALIGQQMAELRDIRTAGRRIESGTYGICIDCGQDIEHRRLQAYPIAERCAACQSVHERTFAEPTHSTL